jgi:TfoX/Sxy family transcriptional regulator of competence genes
MATSEATMQFIEDQISHAGEIRSQKMFGEYALYIEKKVVGFVCDDTLFLKITDVGRKFAGKHYKEGEAYPGSKPYMQIPGEMLEDSEWLTQIVEITAEALPAPKPKAKKKKK